jgi:putative hemolysin
MVKLVDRDIAKKRSEQLAKVCHTPGSEATPEWAVLPH